MYERIWNVKCVKAGFTYRIFIRTTEEKLQGYIETELPDAVSYSGATEAEELAAKVLKLPIYCY